MVRRWRTMTVTSLAGGLAVAAAVLSGAAYGDIGWHVDGQHDVLVFDGQQSQVDPSRHVGDITRVEVDHRYRRVVLHARYAHLLQKGARLDVARFVTDGRAFEVDLMTDRQTGWQGHAVLAVETSAGAVRKVTCAGLRHRTDFSAMTVKLSVPRSCLGYPRWVRVGFGTLVLGTSTVAADDGLSSRVADDLALTRRLYRH